MPSGAELPRRVTQKCLHFLVVARYGVGQNGDSAISGQSS